MSSFFALGRAPKTISVGRSNSVIGRRATSITCHAPLLGRRSCLRSVDARHLRVDATTNVTELSISVDERRTD
ncbi:MAG: hypothetical protein MUE68_02685 [Bacteroidetes bacterium]|nr:hypothetical protein [Bacteroidota bacterium]